VTILGDDTVARELLTEARRLVARPAADMLGLWPRASALLARQSLEVALKTYWSYVAPGTEEASMRAQLLCLEGYLPAAAARQAHLVWTALSRASHHHVYELQPTREELLVWFDSVSDVVDQTERTWRK
jgi:hypothetical protein